MCGKSIAGGQSVVGAMSPRAQVVAVLAGSASVGLSGLCLIVFVPGVWWVFTTYGWVAFPTFSLVLRGLAGSPAGSSDSRVVRPSAADKERELLEALRKEGEVTPVLAATGTSLTVAKGGLLEVRARGGKLFYGLWGQDQLHRWESGVLNEGKRGVT